MTPKFSDAIDPVLLHVLDLLDRISANETIDAQEERTRIRGLLDRAEAALGQGKDWQLARYALATWTDEMLIDAPWSGRDWWQEHALEVEIFKSREAFTEFYHKAAEASSLSEKNALEVFYVCVVLGFRGIYRDSSAMALTEQLGLPPSLEAWAKQTALAIRLGQGRPPITESARPATGAPPLEGKFLFVGSSLVGVGLAAIAIVLACIFFVI